MPAQSALNKIFPKAQLPAETQIGANTFAFLAEGKVFFPIGNLYDIGIRIVVQNNELNINARNSSTSEKINIFLEDLRNIGDYDINTNNKQTKYCINNQDFYAVIVLLRKTTDCKYSGYETDTNTQTGNLVITKLDLANKIISGTFEFKLEKDGCSTINATQGRFDLKIE